MEKEHPGCDLELFASCFCLVMLRSLVEADAYLGMVFGSSIPTGQLQSISKTGILPSKGLGGIPCGW